MKPPRSPRKCLRSSARARSDTNRRSPPKKAAATEKTHPAQEKAAAAEDYHMVRFMLAVQARYWHPPHEPRGTQRGSPLGTGRPDGPHDA